MGELLLRFLIGGAVVTLFAIFGDICRPKSFAGLFGAAPSIALATLGLTIHKHGDQYAATEARSMVLGAIAFFFYAVTVSHVLMRYRPRTELATLGLMPIWFGVAFGLWAILLR